MAESQKKIFGGNWKYQFYLVPDCDWNPKAGKHYWNVGDSLNELVNDERIIDISIWKKPLTAIQLAKAIFYHAIVVFETSGWWWSIEKVDDTITIQRAKKWENVAYRYRGINRTKGLSGIDLMKTMSLKFSSVKVSDFFEMLWESRIVNDEYDLVDCNCQDFAEQIWTHFEILEKFSYQSSAS